MVCIVCDGKLDCGAHCVMGSWTAQANCWQGGKCHMKKCFFWQKEAGWPYNFWGQPTWPTFM